MKIVEATDKELSKLMKFYNDMCQSLNGKDFLPNGDKGGFPSVDMVSAAIKENGQYIGLEDEKIMAAFILSHDCNKAYRTAHWQIEAPRNEVLVLHALRVSPQYAKRGYSKQLVEYAIQIAKKKKQKAIRLDVLEGNIIPEKMYASYGFRYVETVEICYEDIGEPMKFHLMEMVI